jgi:hypothetical protein
MRVSLRSAATLWRATSLNRCEIASPRVSALPAPRATQPQHRGVLRCLSQRGGLNLNRPAVRFAVTRRTVRTVPAPAACPSLPAPAAAVIVHVVRFSGRADGNASAQGYATGRYRMTPLAGALVGAVVAVDATRGLTSLIEAMVAHVELSPSLIFLVAMTGSYTHSLHHRDHSRAPARLRAPRQLVIGLGKRGGKLARIHASSHCGHSVSQVRCAALVAAHTSSRALHTYPARHSNLDALRRGGWPLVGCGPRLTWARGGETPYHCLQDRHHRTTRPNFKLYRPCMRATVQPSEASLGGCGARRLRPEKRRCCMRWSHPGRRR